MIIVLGIATILGMVAVIGFVNTLRNSDHPCFDHLWVGHQFRYSDCSKIILVMMTVDSDHSRNIDRPLDGNSKDGDRPRNADLSVGRLRLQKLNLLQRDQSAKYKNNVWNVLNILLIEYNRYSACKYFLYLCAKLPPAKWSLINTELGSEIFTTCPRSLRGLFNKSGKTSWGWVGPSSSFKGVVASYQAALSQEYTPLEGV